MNRPEIKNFYIPAVALIGLIAAGIFHFSGRNDIYRHILTVAMAVGTLPILWRMAKDLLRGHFGIDIIAIVAIVGSFLLGQFLAGTVILLMLSGGEALESYALDRARRELTALLERVPSSAHIRRGGEVIDINAGDVKVGDTLIIKPGESVPADGVIIDGSSELDESAITGESVPVFKHPGSLLYSGSVNQDGVLEIRATRPASESTYENIVKMVKQASESRAPVVRLADRYSAWFTIITFSLAAAAWLISHDPIRLLAVLVVATPCPLILATPIAIMSGVSRSASRGIIVKSGGALEKLSEVNAFIFDKTGTLTLGTPEVTGIKAFDPSQNNVLHIAASLDQLSGHILARSLQTYAKSQNLRLEYPENFQETFGDGVQGKVAGIRYIFGKLDFLRQQGITVPKNILDEHERFQQQGDIAVYLGSGGKLLGAVLFADVVRPETKRLFANLQRMKLDKIVMLTGDRKNVAEKVAAQIGLSDIHAGCLPEDKVKEVQEHKREFGSVAMIGDGVNDAPALAAADVGIAIGGHGSTASSEVGDIVITTNNLSRVGTALSIARKTISIAKQSIFAGMGVSVVLMIIAALGNIVPVYGAILQEALDVLVILNALRVNFIKL